MEREFKSKYHRKEPIREFNVDQTLYNAVMNTNEKNMNYNYAQFFGKTMTFGELKFKTDCFATALKRDGVLDEEKVGHEMNVKDAHDLGSKLLKEELYDKLNEVG